MLKELEGKELSELKVIAKELGIDFQKNIGKDKLISKIIADELDVESAPKVEPKKKAIKIEGVDRKNETIQEMKQRMNILKRVRVSANDPQFKGRNGVTLQIGNKNVVVGKFTPFDIIWHIPEPIYKRLKTKLWRETKFKTDPATGNKFPVVRMRPAFVIEDLEPLTSDEIKALAADQAARGSIPGEND